MVFIYCSPLVQSIVLKDFIKFNLECKQKEFTINEALTILSNDFEVHYDTQGNIT
jgi:hypothetical protein